MKKIIYLILAVSILLTSFTLTSYASPYNADYLNKAGLLEYLGFIENFENENPDREVSRREFVLMLGKLMKLDSNRSYEERYYMDISQDDELWNISAQLLESRILTMNEARLFRPNDTILVGEASCAIMKLYGAGNTEYPNYFKFAERFGILNGVSSVKLTYKDVVSVFYNTLIGRPFDIAFPDMEQGSRTYMEMYYGLYFVEGIVNSVNGTSLTSVSGNQLNTIEVGNTVLRCYLNNPYQYLGNFVGAFYTGEENPEVCYLYVRESRTSKLELSGENDPVFDSGTFTLSYRTEKDLVKKINIPQGVNVILNGENVSDDVAGAFGLFTNGSILLISSSGSTQYDTVIIENYYNVSVLSVNSEKQLIYGKDGSVIDVSADYDKTVYLENTDGEKITIGAIEKGNIASVFESANYCRVVISAKKITGTISALFSENGTDYITVGGTEYEPAAGTNFDFNVGRMVTVYLDCFGYIAELESTRADGMQYGWIIRHYSRVNGFSSKVLLRIFGENNKISEYALAEKTMIDESMCKTTAEQISALEAGKSGINEQLILFKLSDVGEIREIDTVAPNVNSDGLFIDGTANTVTYGSSFIGPDIVTDGSTIVFIIPSIAAEKDDEASYKVTNNSAFKAWSNNNVVSYRSSDSSVPGKAELVVLYRNLLGDSTMDDGIYVVTNVRKTWDDETDTVRNQIEVMEGKTVKNFYAAEGYLIANDANIRKGNVLRLSLNSKEEVISTTLLYGTKTDGTEVKATKDDTANWGTDSPSTVSWGYVTACGDDLAELSLTQNGTAFMRFPTATTAICVYENGKARAGTQGDIAEAMVQDYMVFVNMYRGSLLSITIIK